MKAFSVILPPPADSASPLPSVRIYADSAIGRDVMPLFVPDIPGRWLCRFSLAARVNRLGKNISTKFASRYVDAISVVCLLIPDPEDALSCSIARSGALSILDGVITTGRWIEADLGSLRAVTVTVGGESLEADGVSEHIAALVSASSRLATLKTGDILVMPEYGITLPMTIGTTVQAAVDGTDCLRLKIR